MTELILEALADALIDSVKLLPFLFVTYLAMEYLESRTGEKTKRFIRRAGHWGPLWGSVLGIVPQCGFSAAAANLYAGRVITLGTLMAVLLSTSDEMLPIMISERAALPLMAKVLAVKVVIAFTAGFAVDFFVRCLRGGRAASHSHAAGSEESTPPHGHGTRRANAAAHSHETECADAAAHSHGAECTGAAHSHAHHGHAAPLQEAFAEEDAEDYQIERLCEHEHCHCEGGGIVRPALRHTVNIFVFVLLITAALNVAFALLGEENLLRWFGGQAIGGELFAGLLGLIPNCASSVAITQLYLRGIFGPSQLIAGLLVSAGVGLLVLFRVNPGWRDNVRIMALLYGIGIAGGLLVRALGVTF